MWHRQRHNEGERLGCDFASTLHPAMLSTITRRHPPVPDRPSHNAMANSHIDSAHRPHPDTSPIAIVPLPRQPGIWPHHGEAYCYSYCELPWPVDRP
eukprot:scaffold5287_cov59-Attheya_sp.AAC.1